MFMVVTNGLDVIYRSGQVLVDAMTHSAMVPVVVTQRLIARREWETNRQQGIDRAKKNGGNGKNEN